MDVINEIIAERKRQIEVEGYDAAHDDGHPLGELGRAAACYMMGQDPPGGMWPWSWEYWKPTTRRRDMIKAAALIVAEIERLDRAREEG